MGIGSEHPVELNAQSGEKIWPNNTYRKYVKTPSKTQKNDIKENTKIYLCFARVM